MAEKRVAPQRAVPSPEAIPSVSFTIANAQASSLDDASAPSGWSAQLTVFDIGLTRLPEGTGEAVFRAFYETAACPEWIARACTDAALAEWRRLSLALALADRMEIQG